MERPDLTPAIVQDAESNRVLMLAWMDEEALRRTRETGEAWFWSRSRQGSGGRAKRPATRSRSKSCARIATATRFFSACARPAPSATPARSRASRPGCGA